jgi:exonuclease III
LSKSLFGTTKDIVFIGVYNHPNSSPFYENKDYKCSLEPLEQFMLQTLETNDVHFVLGGDFNARIGNWFNDVVDDDDLMEEDSFCRNSEIAKQMFLVSFLYSFARHLN